jgi:lipopolysaccharide export system permease protein
VFFRAGDDQRIEEINTVLETAIEDLSYSTDKMVLAELNNYPIVSPSAHTRPFRRKWLNIIMGLLLPVGLILYIRMIRFRLRLYNDLRTIRHTTDRIIPRALELSKTQVDDNTLL